MRLPVLVLRLTRRIMPGVRKLSLNIRRTEITMATAGSPLAIQHVKGYIDDLVDRNS